MEMKKLGDNIIEIDGKFRVEPGPVRKTGVIATKELLDDSVTAKHYQVGHWDASGKKIEIGKPMDYIDWRSRERVFYVYALRPVDEMVDGKKVVIDRFIQVGVHTDEQAALSQATTLAVASAK